MSNFKALFTILIFAAASYSSQGYSCTSDYSCSYGEACVKAQYAASGYCAKKVDSNGIQQYTPPSSKSIGIEMGDDMCSWNTDCPVGFKCVKNGGIKGHCMK